MSVLDYLTPEWLKNTALAGVDLTLDDGTPFDDRVFSDSLEYALSVLEQNLGIQIDRFTHTDERHDGEQGGGASFWPFRLDHRPVIEVKALRLQYGTFPEVKLPVSWANVVNWEHGHVHLIPNAQGLGSFKFTSGVPLIMGDVFRPEVWIPGYFAFDYTAGFQVEEGTLTIPEGEREVEVTFLERMRLRYNEVKLEAVGDDLLGVSKINVIDRSYTGFSVRTDVAPAGGDLVFKWSVTTIPADLKRAIALLAASLPLDIAGDLIAGAGIANFSISMDGLSQSVGTTASATNAGYGSRVIQFLKELGLIWPALRAKYRIPNMAAF